MNKSIVACAALICAVCAHGEHALALMPFTIAGRITDYNRATLDDGAATIRVRAISSDGSETNLVTKTTTFTSDSTRWNFVASIPMASVETKGYATAGGRLVFEVQDPWGETWTTLLSEGESVATAPGAVLEKTFMLADDDDGDGVSDKYVSYLSYRMRLKGVSKYDKNADWDGDGVTNYGEYLAGTDPFSSSDVLKIKSSGFETDSSGNRRLKIVFTTAVGRTYSVGGTDNVAKSADEWKESSFALTPDESPTHKLIPEQTTVETKTIYIPVDASRSASFYRLEVE